MTSSLLRAPFVVLDDARSIPGAALVFEGAAEWIEAHEPDEALAALDRLEAARAAGRWIAGAFGYELGYALEPRLAGLMPDGRREPLLSAGIFDAPRRLDAGAAEALFEGLAREPATLAPAAEGGWDRGTYAAAFACAKAFIEAGDVYQLNLTFPMRTRLAGDPCALFARLRLKARAGYGALMRAPGFDALSLSPELFVQAWPEGRIAARPMKGTVRREPGAIEDAAARDALTRDPKQRAENLMIVDLIRNDLARIAAAGSVTVTDLFSAETYPTLHTMTSGVEARLARPVGLREAFAALFPCGSVTGAPKIRAMEILRELEAGPRGLYCGSIGAAGPDGSMRFNVAIRTLVCPAGAGEARFAVGSGVVFDSDADAEYDECLLKARFALDPADPFELLETMRWERGRGVRFLDLHVARLEDSARWFAYRFDRAEIDEALRAAIEAASGDSLRLRLTLDVAGVARVAAAPLDEPFAEAPDPDASPWRLVVSPERLDPRDVHVRRKTTRRAVYDGEHARLTAGGAADEVLFLNREGFVADASRTSVFAVLGGRWLTPPLEDGALDGVLRRALIAKADPPVEARRLTLDDLRRADAILVGNSVRGLRRAILV